MTSNPFYFVKFLGELLFVLGALAIFLGALYIACRIVSFVIWECIGACYPELFYEKVPSYAAAYIEPLCDDVKFSRYSKFTAKVLMAIITIGMVLSRAMQ